MLISSRHVTVDMQSVHVLNLMVLSDELSRVLIVVKVMEGLLLVRVRLLGRLIDHHQVWLKVILR